MFVHLGPHHTFEEPGIEAIDIRQIYDKFPEKKGGLKELYEKGPPHLFFLVKFWVSILFKVVVRSSQQRCSVKKVFLEISQNSQENTFVRASFLIKLQA